MTPALREPITVDGPDFVFTSHGSICLLEPLTPQAEEWIGNNVDLNDETQFWGRAVVLEPRYAGDILNGIAGDGLAVARSRHSLN